MLGTKKLAVVAVVLVLLAAWQAPRPGVEATDLGLKSRRQPYKFDLPKNDIFHMNSAIPDNHQVSAFLYKGETKLFFYEQQKKDRGLYIAVTPCTSSVAWSVRYKNHTDNGKRDGSGNLEMSASGAGPVLENHRGSETSVFRRQYAPAGLYVVEVSPLERESYVQFYATEDAEGPAALSVPHRTRIKLRRRHRRRQLAVSWEQSKVDPHLTHYCLVVNTRRHYQSLCEARGEKQGVIPPPAPRFNHPLEQAQAHKNELASKAARANASRLGRGSELHEDIVLQCLGKRTQYTLTNLEHGKVYHFDVFAVNKKTNLSFSYGRVALKYDQRSKPTSLRDGKPTRVNLRKLDGRATFKFKVGRKAEQPLQMYVMPCGGGAVEAEVTSQGKVVVPRRRVQGYEELKLPDAVRGQRFLLKVVARNPDELSRISALEVLATTRAEKDFPLPAMPQVRQVHEFPGLSDCRSVTFGWVPSPDTRASRYCVTAIEDGWEDVAGPTPDQCDADKKPQLRHVRVCMERTATSNSTVMTHAVTNLKPGRSYVIQVTVRKPRGKALSYDLLQVITKDTCS